MNNDYRDHLEHHGIPGMKWGVRRYQNEDGSLTDKGKKRYANQKTFELNQADQDRAKAAYKASNAKQYAGWDKERISRLSAKKAKAESIRDNAEISGRKRAKQEKKIEKISRKQARAKEALKKHLSDFDDNNKKIKEIEKSIDKTIKKLSKENYSIDSYRINRLVDSTYYVDYYMPGTLYKVRSKKS